MSSRVLQSRPPPKAQPKAASATAWKPKIPERRSLGFRIMAARDAFVARVLSYHPRTRFYASIIMGFFCLTGLWMADYIETKHPPTEEEFRKASRPRWWRLDFRDPSNFEPVKVEVGLLKHLEDQESKQR